MKNQSKTTAKTATPAIKPEVKILNLMYDAKASVIRFYNSEGLVLAVAFPGKPSTAIYFHNDFIDREKMPGAYVKPDLAQHPDGYEYMARIKTAEKSDAFEACKTYLRETIKGHKDLFGYDTVAFYLRKKPEAKKTPAVKVEESK